MVLPRKLLYQFALLWLNLDFDFFGIYSVGSEEAPATQSKPTTKRTKKKDHKEVDLDFTTSIYKEFTDIFAPPKNSKSLLLPANTVPCSNRLPEDCHYQPEDLAKLFLLPDVLVI